MYCLWQRILRICFRCSPSPDTRLPVCRTWFQPQGGRTIHKGTKWRWPSKGNPYIFFSRKVQTLENGASHRRRCRRRCPPFPRRHQLLLTRPRLMRLLTFFNVVLVFNVAKNRIQIIFSVHEETKVKNWYPLFSQRAWTLCSIAASLYIYISSRSFFL